METQNHELCQKGRGGHSGYRQESQLEMEGAPVRRESHHQRCSNKELRGIKLLWRSADKVGLV